MKRAQIVGVGAYAPQRILTNAELEKLAGDGVPDDHRPPLHRHEMRIAV